MSKGLPEVLLMSLRKSSTSSLIWFSRDLLPNPKFLNVVKENDLCSFHKAPDVDAMPEIARIVYIKFYKVHYSKVRVYLGFIFLQEPSQQQCKFIHRLHCQE